MAGQRTIATLTDNFPQLKERALQRTRDREISLEPEDYQLSTGKTIVELMAEIADGLEHAFSMFDACPTCYAESRELYAKEVQRQIALLRVLAGA